MAELQGDVDETPLVAAGPVETAQPPVDGGLIVRKVDFSAKSAAGPTVAATRTLWMVWSGRELLVVIGDGVNDPLDHAEIPRQFVAYVKERQDQIARQRPFAIFVPHGRQGTGFLPVLGAERGLRQGRALRRSRLRGARVPSTSSWRTSRA